MIHLDTNFLVRSLRAGTAEDTRLTIWLQTGEQLGLSAMAWAEFLCGPLNPGDESFAQALFPVIEPVTVADSQKAADLFNATGRRSRSLADCLIAAVALRLGAQIATGNLSDFQPFVPHGLTLA